MKTIFSQYVGLAKALHRYYVAYGGVRQFILSPLAHLALISTVINQYSTIHFDWVQTVSGSFPTILGFSLAAYTLIFALMGGTLKSALSDAIVDNRDISYLGLINATFFHAIFIQIVTYTYFITSRSSFIYERVVENVVLGYFDGDLLAARLNDLMNVFGSFMTVYSIVLMFSLLLGVFRLALVAASRNV